jgi:uncharacterized protein (TIGR02996 family)
MSTDDGFLMKLSANPADDTTRLVYADWLEEQGDPTSTAKAEFLRLTVQRATPAGKKGQKKKREERLQQLAAGLDTDWLAVVSRLAIENCRTAANQRNAENREKAKQEGRQRWIEMVPFGYLCDRRWEDLSSTDNRAVRFCDTCQQNVHYCDTITEARRHAEDGQCIALDLGVIRRDRDLGPPMMMLGRVNPADLQRQHERMEPDAVSAERERRKCEANREAEDT